MKKNKKEQLDLTPIEKVEYLEKQAQINKWFAPKFQCIISFILALVLLVGGSTAYFTDYVHVGAEATAGTVQISIDDSGINLLNAEGLDILNPGDVRDFGLSIKNEGNKSVDTQLVITLTSSVPMSNYLEDGGPEIEPMSLRGRDAIEEGDESDFAYHVFSSEYELYYASDVLYIDGYGYYPKAGAQPIQSRYMNAAQTQIVYVLDKGVLSGNSALDEQEAEYMFSKTVSLSTTVTNYTAGTWVEDGVRSVMVWVRELPSGADTAIVPETTYCENFDTGEYEDFERPIDTVSVWDFLDCGISTVYIPRTVTWIWDIEEQRFITINEAAAIGVNFIYYDSCEDDVLSTLISDYEYNSLSDVEKANCVKCSDMQEYDLVLLFDPHADNKFQNSSVSIEVDIKAKQHRNTSAGWELVDTILASSIDTSVFEVNYDKMGRVELTGVQRGVDFYSLTDVVIPEGVEIIPANFFNSFDNLVSVSLPSTLKEIGESAFFECGSLESINFPEGLEYIGDRAFAYCSSLTDIAIPGNVVIDEYAFRSTTNLNTVTISKDAILKENAFKYAGVKTLIFEEGRTEIPAYAFIDCRSLKSVVLPNSIKVIGEGAFNTCIELESINLPNGLTTIGYGAFYDCYKLTNVVIPDSVTLIDIVAFTNCRALTEITIPGSVKIIEDSAFQGCEKLTTVVVEEGVKNIDGYAFYGCDKLTQITIPNSVKKIGPNVFGTYSYSYVNTTVYSDNNIVNTYNWTDDMRSVTFLPLP